MRIALAVLVAASGLGTGCSPTVRDPDRGATMTIVVDGRAAPLMSRYDLKYLLFLGLERLATSWEPSSDHRTWTVWLRDDVRWHDGTPLTAHDVAFSFELFRHPDVLGGSAVESTRVVDEHTIELVLQRPSAHPPLLEWTVYFPKHLLQDLDPAEFYEWDFWTRPVGNGPYRLVRHVPQTVLEFEANPDFYAGRPSIDRIVAKLSSANRVIELTSGGADAAYDLAPADLLKLQADPRFVTYYDNDWSELYLIYWNHGHPLLSDARARRALGHALDRRQLARLIGLPDEVPLVGGLGNDGGVDPERRRGWDRVPDYDPRSAERLLDEAGWIDAGGDGVRRRAGREARFTLLVPQGGSLAADAQGVFIQDQLRRVGVMVEIRLMEMSVVREALRSGRFDAAIMWDNQDAHTILWTWFGGPTDVRPGETGDVPVRFGYHEPEAARLLERVLAAGDLAAHDTLYLRFNDIIRRDMPVLLLFPGVYHYAARRRIHGFGPSSRFWLARPDELWIEEQP